MMFLCSVASELSNYDSCQSVHFCVVIRGNPWLDQAEMEGVRFERSLWEPEVLKVHEFVTEPVYGG